MTNVVTRGFLSARPSAAKSGRSVPPRPSLASLPDPPPSKKSSRAARIFGGSSSVLLACGLAACDKKGSEEAQGQRAAASAVSAPAPSASAAPRPWFEGNWSAAFQAKPHAMYLDPKLGGIKEWQKDPGEPGTGAGTLKVSIDAQGQAEAQTDGALGRLQGTGAVEGNSLRVRLTPLESDPSGFSGLLNASREGDGWVGNLRASSGDSKVVRSADVKLEKK